MSRIKDSEIDLKESGKQLAILRAKSRTYGTRIVNTRGIIDVLLDSCDSNLETMGYLTDDNLELLKDKNTELKNTIIKSKETILKIIDLDNHTKMLKASLRGDDE